MDPSAVNEQIRKILHSKTFAGKSQLRKLLEVLFAGIDSQNTLSPDLIIKELWPAEVRTKRSADVATEINRLRHALHSYYKGEGKSDPIAIVLPNRAPTALNGTQEKLWIAANPRACAEIGREENVEAERKRPASPAKPRRTPIVITAAFAILGILGVVAYFALRALTPTDQPALGRLDGSTLLIANAKGKELWKKSFPGGFVPGRYYEKDSGPRIWFEDLEGHGHTSVLFSYSPAAGQQPHSSTLICYSERGKEKWRWSPGRFLPELNGSPAVFQTVALLILKATPNHPARIVVESMDPWWPSQIAILDANGKTISEYWHSGNLGYMTLAEVNGKEQIIATGVANGYDHQATLVVLDPDRVFGASRETESEFQIHGMGTAQESLRLLFPRSDLNRASLVPFNLAVDPAVVDGHLRLSVRECPYPKDCPIQYEFDKNWRLISVHPANGEFRADHDRFYQNGKGAHSFGLEEQDAFLKVRCLVGCNSEFVSLAQKYEPASSFETGWTAKKNPNGVWSYGYSSGFAGPIKLYDRTIQNGVNGSNALYWVSSSVDERTSPSAEYNDGPAYNDANVDFLEKEFVLVAGVGGQHSDLIFTAPVAGEYSISGSFRGAQYGAGTVVGVVAGGKLLFNSSVKSIDQNAPFNMTLNLQARNSVVFSVGPGEGFQNTGLSVTITKPCALTDKPTSTPTGEIECSGRPTGK